MSLPHIILGLLQRESMTGYDLKNSCFDKTIAHLWSADQAQIYRTLDKLVEQGWIVFEIEIQHDRPNRKIYSLTDTGHQELLRWLQQSQPLPNLREPLLIQLFFAQQSQFTDEMIIHLLEQQLTAHSEKLTCYQQVNRQYKPSSALSNRSTTRQEILHGLVIDLLIEREKTHIEWLKKAIDTVGHQGNEI
jgi:PadR family transcriptional regulator, regulatory protein AphA